MSTKKLTKAELADLFGESPKQIQRYVAEGIPCSGSGKDLRFPWPSVRAWRDQRIRRLEREKLERDKPMDLEEARRRKMEAEARLAEIDVDTRLGQLVPVTVVDDIVGKVCDRMLPILQNVPSNYGMRLEEVGVPAGKAEDVLEAIATELTKALQATADAHEEDAEADDEPADAAEDAHVA